MATVPAYGGAPATANLCTAQTGNGATTNIVDRLGPIPGMAWIGPALLKIVTTVGATPTCTYLVEGSADGTNWFPAAIADPATPTTVTAATFTITSAATTFRVVQPNQPYKYLRITFSANTNVTNTVDYYPF